MLKCPMAKCKSSVNGVSGYDEINRFIKHIAKVHGQRLNMQEALEFRIVAEKKQAMTHEQFLSWLAEGP